MLTINSANYRIELQKAGLRNACVQPVKAIELLVHFQLMVHYHSQFVEQNYQLPHIQQLIALASLCQKFQDRTRLQRKSKKSSKEPHAIPLPAALKVWFLPERNVFGQRQVIRISCRNSINCQNDSRWKKLSHLIFQLMWSIRKFNQI